MGRLLSWSERPTHDRMVPGSNPGRPTTPCGGHTLFEGWGTTFEKKRVPDIAMVGRERIAEAVKQTAIGGEAEI